ncbi:hypothetical protein KPL40_19730 [Clostridium gasigenes]|uniref:hypothetical protein n=1 Tax=Clostridium gasigenes TaxID=94869 RepID=UPI001C0DDFD0|nr:hypothetical protein [Clostridium gasigenes]MBU3134633.1 hypothetical protein [Clostridium gasigenes]
MNQNIHFQLDPVPVFQTIICKVKYQKILMKSFKERKVDEGLSIIVNMMINNLAEILAEKFNNRLFNTLDIIYRNIIPNNVIAIVVQKICYVIY